jgi:hypothetical protein
MKFHTSHYEEDLGWININVRLPEHNTRVKLAYIRLIDWNIEELIWKSEGWITSGGNWSIKMKLLVVYGSWNKFKIGVNNKPTHWKKISN